MLQKKFFSKLFSWLPIFLLFIFCIDIYFSVPNADDYDFFLWIKKYGFWGFQKHMYLFQNGRFVSSFFIACYSSLFNLIHIYWIFPLCFFILFYFSLLLVIKVFCKYLQVEIKSLENYSYAAWLALFFILVCKELSSFLFWMPGIINYQLVVTFFILGITCLIKHHIEKNYNSFVMALICFALASGLHELFFLLITPGLLLYLIIRAKNPVVRNKILLIILDTLIPFLISFFSAGTAIRQTHTNMMNDGIITVLLNTFLHVVFLFGHLFTVPFLYIVLFSMFVVFRSVDFHLSYFFKKIKLSYLIVGLILQPVLIFLIAIIKISSGLPERAENLLLIQASFFLLLIVIKLAVEKKEQLSFILSIPSGILFSLLFFLCFASPNMINGFKGIISGYFYKEISQARLKNLNNNGIKSLNLINYEDELDSFYTKKYHKKIPLKLMKIADQNKIILFSDVYDLPEGQINSFRQYHHIDTVKMPYKISFRDTLIYLPMTKDGSY